MNISMTEIVKKKVGILYLLLSLSVVIISLIADTAIAQSIAINEATEIQEFIQQQQKQIASYESEKIQDTPDLFEPKDSKDTRTDDLDEKKESRIKPIDLNIEPQVKSLNLPLKKFGYDLFSDAPTTFAPATDIPIPSDYIIGPGDNINIILFGKENREITQQVTREGSIFLPGIGPIPVAGLPFDQMKTVITQRIENEMIGTQSSITLGQLRSIQIFILGDAYQPGSYLISSLSTLTNALFVSGGVKENGSLRDIQLKRNGKIIVHFDLYDLLLKGDTSKDQRLKSGDVIFIPPLKKTAGISGEVRRPGIYEVLEDETFEDLISYSGGLLPTAHLPSAEVERIATDGLTLLDIDLRRQTISSLSVEDGDILHLYPILNTMENSILLSGYVKRPGFYAYKEGLRISNLFSSSQDLLPYTDRQYLIIKRDHPITGEVEALHVNLNKVFENKNSKIDHLLMARDEIFIFSNKSYSINTMEVRELDGNRTVLLQVLIATLKQQADNKKHAMVVNVSGNVNFEGNYPLTDGMTLNDLILAAGGLKESTYIREVEITSQNLSFDEYITNRLSISLMDKESLQTTLSPGDQILFKKMNESILTATILGEIKFPGTYTLKDSETLSELLRRAGGLKSAAFIEGAIFQRNSLKEMEQQRLAVATQMLEKEIALASTQGQQLGQSQDTTNLSTLSELQQQAGQIQALGRLIIDLESIINNPSRDIILENKDTLYIPRLSQSVSVLGEVYVPASHVFESNKSVKDYIELSGSFTPNAKQADVYIIKADGSIVASNNNSKFFRSSSNNIQPGDTIIVPIETQVISGMKAASDITQIIYQMAVATAAVGSF